METVVFGKPGWWQAVLDAMGPKHSVAPKELF